MAKKTTTDEIIEKIRDNYQSIILGLIVFLIAAAAIYRAVSTQPQKKVEEKEAISVEEQVDEKGRIVTNEYTVKKNDTLWSIAEMKYGSGYNWVDIAKENALKNADQIEVNQELKLPSVSPKRETAEKISEASTEKVSITGNQYTVQKGDHLWGIAVRAYGDG